MKPQREKRLLIFPLRVTRVQGWRADLPLCQGARGNSGSVNGPRYSPSVLQYPWNPDKGCNGSNRWCIAVVLETYSLRPLPNPNHLSFTAL
jgi:hypothetical protein